MGEVEEADTRKLLRRQTALARFGETAIRSDDLDAVLTEACRLVGEALGTDLAKVMELRENGETLFVRAGVGWKPGVVGETTVKASDDTSEGHVLKTGVPMISPDIAEETRFSYPPFLTENGVKAVANVRSSARRASLPSASCRSTAASRAGSRTPTPPSSAPTPTSSRPRWTACA